MESESSFNPWVISLLIVKFDEKDGQQIQCIFPHYNECITPDMTTDIRMMSMPDCLEPGINHEFMFMVRLRDKRVNHDSDGRLLNCFISFRQFRDDSTKRGFFQQSLVLVTALPYSNLFYNILNRLSAVLTDCPMFEETLTKLSKISIAASTESLQSNNNDILNKVKSPYLPSDISILDDTLEVAFRHFQKWPQPINEKTLKLPFYGDIIEFTVPSLPLYTIHPIRFYDKQKMLDALLKNGGLGGGVGLFSSINFVSVFDHIGLLPHLWTLWELVVTGQNIVIWTPSAAISSAIVTALVSLTAPLAYGGDYRPYINPYDSDMSLFSESVSKKNDRENKSNGKGYSNSNSSDIFEGNATQNSYMNGPIFVKTISQNNNLSTNNPSILIGITNPILLRSVSHIDAALFIPNPEYLAPPKWKSNLSVKIGSTSAVPPGSPSRTMTSVNSMPSPMNSSSLFSLQSPMSLLSSFFSEIDTHTGDAANPSNGSPSSSQKNGNGEPRFSSGDLLDSSPLNRKHGTESSNSSSRTFSALGIAKNSSSSKKNSFVLSTPPSSSSGSSTLTPSPVSPTFKKDKFPTHLKVIGASESIESVYDDWIANGGTKPGSRRKCGMLIVRRKPIVSPDPDVEARLESLGSATIPFLEGDTGVFSDKVSRADDRTVIGNMLLREHFRNLTLALMKPFDSFFWTNNKGQGIITGGRSTPCDTNWIPGIIDKLSNNSNGGNSLGNSNLFCGSCMREEFGIEETLAAIELFEQGEKNEANLPRCLRSCQWRVLMQKFAHSDHFTCWKDWKQEAGNILGNISVSPS